MVSNIVELVKAAMIEGGYPDSDDSGRLPASTVLLVPKCLPCSYNTCVL